MKAKGDCRMRAFEAIGGSSAFSKNQNDRSRSDFINACLISKGLVPELVANR